MRKKLIVGLLGLAVIVAGVAGLSAFTAQVVNITAHAEKDIAVEPIICTEQSNFGADYTEPCFVDPSGGSYGVTLPQVLYDKEIEVTLSNSFFDQDVFFDLTYDVFWECKQYADQRDADGDGIPDCRDEAPLPHDICKIDLDGDSRADTLQHCDPEILDDNIRDAISINAKADSLRCQTLDFGSPSPKPSWTAKEIDFQFSGLLNKATPKCRYELKFLSPPCEGSFNEFTDPLTPPPPVPCHKADKMRHVGVDDDNDWSEDGIEDGPGLGNCNDGTDNGVTGGFDNTGPLIDGGDPDGADAHDPECAANADEDPIDGIDNDGDTLVDEDPGAESVNPQDIDEWADLGDDFKIQVFGHSLAPGP